MQRPAKASIISPAHQLSAMGTLAPERIARSAAKGKSGPMGPRIGFIHKDVSTEGDTR